MKKYFSSAMVIALFILCCNDSFASPKHVRSDSEEIEPGVLLALYSALRTSGSIPTSSAPINIPQQKSPRKMARSLMSQSPDCQEESMSQSPESKGGSISSSPTSSTPFSIEILEKSRSTSQNAGTTSDSTPSSRSLSPSSECLYFDFPGGNSPVYTRDELRKYSPKASACYSDGEGFDYCH